jgi:hypothetical protein
MLQSELQCALYRSLIKLLAHIFCTLTGTTDLSQGHEGRREDSALKRELAYSSKTLHGIISHKTVFFKRTTART